MKVIKLESRTALDWSGKFVDDSSYDVLLNEDAKVYKPDGQLLLILKKKYHSVDAMASAWSVLRDYNPTTTNRGLASGGERKKRVRKDGTLSNTNIAEKVRSGIVGYFERNPRFPFCRACAWNLENPEEFKKLFPMCEEVAKLYAEHGENFYARQKAAYDKTHPDFKIPNTVFSTLTVNKNFRTACHRDAGNMAGTMNAMSVFREGAFAGGILVLPDFRVAVKLDTADCIVFDAFEFHGNTPIVQMSKNFTRCSVVFYYRENMDKCGSSEEELEIVKRRQLGTSLFQETEEE